MKIRLQCILILIVAKTPSCGYFSKIVIFFFLFFSEIQKTAYGRQVKPVLVPIKNETNVRCEHCDLTFSNLVNLKQHQVKKHGKNLQKKAVQLKDRYLCNPKKIIENNFHCDICYRRFAKRSRMIRHIKSVHSADIHRVDLNRFVLPTKKIQMPTWSMIEL